MNKSNDFAPKVSVLMSCYNGERWLGEAIKSVLNQSFENFEFIIVDDGSTDNSSEIIKRFAEQDTRIIVITKSNTGLSDSLNVGIQQARGEWIARLDADDICEPERLEKQLTKVGGNPDLVYVGSGLYEIGECGNISKTFHYPEGHRSLLKNLTTTRKFPPHSSAFYRTEIVRSIGGYRGTLRRAEDHDLWLRLVDIGMLAAIYEPLVKIRKHSNQISHDEEGKRQIIDARAAYCSYWLRHHGYPDPLDNGKVANGVYLPWVEHKLVEYRLFEYFDYIARVKANVAEMRKSPAALFAATRGIVIEPVFLFRYLRIRLFGDLTPRRLAREWVKKTGAFRI